MKRSIGRQMTIVFVSLMLCMIAAYLLINNVFLERFYEVKMQRLLVNAYKELDENVDDLLDIDKDFEDTFIATCRVNGISCLISDTNYKNYWSTVSNERELKIMLGTLNALKLEIEGEHATILAENENYIIQTNNDSYMKTGYLELWGTLSSGDYIFMRILLDSIENSAKISNEFILYISIAALLISVIAVTFLSRHITEPIKELTELSKQMANLDFDARYTSGGKNEIGQLGEHFNRMSEALESTISQLKTANNELQRDIEKKTQVDEMRKEFLANVSHELKTPLALIQGYAEGLQDSVNDDEESRQFYCEVIIDEASKMNKMVKQLLTLNQLEFGDEAVQMERFDLSQLINGAVQSTQILALPAGVELQCSVQDDLHVWGDEFKVEEVLTNYLSNALNHVDGNPKRITVVCEQNGSKIRTCVRNTGMPIPEEDLPKLWGKFYKVDKARTREYGGSGVGLSIVKAIMDSFHEQYGVRNLPDGVEFWFELESADKYIEQN